jgi:hypothetical protein
MTRLKKYLKQKEDQKEREHQLELRQEYNRKLSLLAENSLAKDPDYVGYDCSSKVYLYDTYEHKVIRLRCNKWSCPECGKKKMKDIQHYIYDNIRDWDYVRMLTLTFSNIGLEIEEHYNIFQDAWRRLFLKLKVHKIKLLDINGEYLRDKNGKIQRKDYGKYYKDLSYVNIHEQHLSGYIHRHILISHYIDWGILYDLWNDCLRKAYAYRVTNQKVDEEELRIGVKYGKEERDRKYTRYRSRFLRALSKDEQLGSVNIELWGKGSGDLCRHKVVGYATKLLAMRYVLKEYSDVLSGYRKWSHSRNFPALHVRGKNSGRYLVFKESELNLLFNIITSQKKQRNFIQRE